MIITFYADSGFTRRGEYVQQHSIWKRTRTIKINGKYAGEIERQDGDWWAEIYHEYFPGTGLCSTDLGECTPTEAMKAVGRLLGVSHVFVSNPGTRRQPPRVTVLEV